MTENKQYSFNVNKNTIEFDGKFKAYVNIVDGQRIVDLLNEQHETIQRLEAQLSHLEYRFFEYRNKAKGLPKDKVEETLQKRYNHLQKTQQETEKPPRYWQGAIMEIEVIANCLGVDLE